MNAEHPPQPSPDTSTSSTTSRSLTASNPAPTTANRQFGADPAEERPRTSPAEAPRFRRSTNHTGPQTGRRPRRAKRELDPSDDHRQTFDQREEFDHAGHAGDQSHRSSVEALTFRRTPIHTVPRGQRPPRRATGQRQPSDDPAYPPTSSTTQESSHSRRGIRRSMA